MILLSGIRNGVDGPLTRISDARLALKLLSEEDLRSLRDNLYIINVPYRWRKNGVTSTSKVPLVQGDGEFPDISAVFYPGMLEPQSKKPRKLQIIFMKLLRLYLLELMYNQKDYYTLITE